MSLRGGPDYGVWAPKHTVTTLADMAELAARLGSINTFNRRGDTVWMDDFEHNINKWIHTTTGTGGSVTLSTEAARNGNQSIKLLTGNLAGNLAFIDKRFVFPVPGPIAIEFSFTLDSNTRLINLTVTIPTPTVEAATQIEYDLTTKDLRLAHGGFETGSLWHTLDPNLSLQQHPTAFNTIKLVLNSDTLKLIRLTLNHRTFDLTDFGMYNETTGATPALYTRIAHITNANLNTPLYIDDFILTQNEHP